MQKIKKVRFSIQLALGTILVLFIWWATITGYTIGDPIDPFMVLWGVVFVFGAIFGPVIGLLVWSILIKEIVLKYKGGKK